MRLPPSHREPDLYRLSRQLLYDCYELTQDLDLQDRLPRELRRAALLSHLALGKALKKKKRKKRRKKFRSVRDCLLILGALLEALRELNLVGTAPASETALTLMKLGHRIDRLLPKS